MSKHKKGCLADRGNCKCSSVRCLSVEVGSFSSTDTGFGVYFRPGCLLAALSDISTRLLRSNQHIMMTQKGKINSGASVSGVMCSRYMHLKAL